MKERPILFSGPMVRAILEGRKTQTRRVVKPQPPEDHPFPQARWDGGAFWWNDRDDDDEDLSFWPSYENALSSPYGSARDRLWVREEHYRIGHWEKVEGVKARTRSGRQRWRFVADTDGALFGAPVTFRKGRHHRDPETPAWHKRLARFMPRKFSRITLEVSGVRVERLNDISDQDAIAEGIIGEWFDVRRDVSSVASYRRLWESINGPGTWDANPWVWVITFKRVE